MIQDNLLLRLYQSPKTVFTAKDIALLWGENQMNNLKAKIAYHVNAGNLIRLRNGIYVKDRQYNPRELATSIYVPSYISFETVLRDEGVLFQHYDSIFAASIRPREVTCDGRTYVYRKLSDDILYCPEGIAEVKGVATATRERAFLDMLYLHKRYHFDNLAGIDWDACFRMAPLYHNQQMLQRLTTYHHTHAE